MFVNKLNVMKGFPWHSKWRYFTKFQPILLPINSLKIGGHVTYNAKVYVLNIRSFFWTFLKAYSHTLQCCTFGIKRVNIHSNQIWEYLLFIVHTYVNFQFHMYHLSHHTFRFSYFQLCSMCSFFWDLLVYFTQRSKGIRQ